jgi:hypothetical protein
MVYVHCLAKASRHVSDAWPVVSGDCVSDLWILRRPVTFALLSMTLGPYLLV